MVVHHIQVNVYWFINHANFETADNTYVQNQASFTNGKTRGMTRATVEGIHQAHSR